MPKITYKTTKFRKNSRDIIKIANTIIEEYQADDIDLTLRQLYYQFVARDLLPNTQREYVKLGQILNKARLSGLIDWSAIVDRTRAMKENSHWDSPQQILETCASQFRLDTRETQDVYLEVWIEKDALVGVIERVCRELDVPYFSCRGYSSQSAMWRAGQRLRTAEVSESKRTLIIQLSDHDPSGINMTDDIRNRLCIFGCNTKVNRIALTEAQVAEYGCPPNAAKQTDSRYEKYEEEFGDESWELDALDPRTIMDLVRQEIDDYTDMQKRVDCIEQQTAYRDRLGELAENWED